MAEIAPDNKAAAEFLRRWSPEGPWVVTSIRPDRKAIDTKTFHPDDEIALGEWLGKYNGERNLYWHVNPPTRDLSKKAEREDIKSVDWLHVDIDPRAGEDIDEERVRALGLLKDKLPQGVPPPTVIIFSGGGYQGFWKLQEPIPINGELALAEDAKRWNQQLEALFSADNCHNIDRIMRLPGTINLPDARKVKKGRVPILAELLEFHDDRVYPLDKFTPAPAVQMDDTGFGGGGGGDVKISGNIERLEQEDLDRWGVPDRVKIILAQGSHPDEPKKGDNSRSAWLFDAICQLVRAEVPDEAIFSIITDPAYGISESVLDKGANAEKYAIRQIGRAKEEAINPDLRMMNDKHAVIGNFGGKCRVIEEVYDEALERTRLTRQSFEDIRNRYIKPIAVGKDDKGNMKYVPLGKWWLLNIKRRQYDTVVFAPEREVKDAYNLWRGFACQSLPGDCSIFMDHLLRNICGGRQDHFEYVIGWMARMVQKPATPGEVALVLRGGRGVGKSLFARELGYLLGRHFLSVSNPSHLVGNFNSHLRDVVLLFAEEAFYAGDKKHASILKTLITEKTITIEAKGIDAEAAPNYVHLIMASNDMHVVPAGGDERRYMVLDVATDNQRDSKFFGRFLKQMENGGREALLHFLRTYDLDGFQVRTVPNTDALREQKLLSLSVEEEWWYQKLSDGITLSETGGESWLVDVPKSDLVDDYIEYTRKFNVTRRGNQTALGRFLLRVCPTITTQQRLHSVDIPTGEGFTKKRKRRVHFYIFPSLEVARERWVQLYGSEDWKGASQLALPAAAEEDGKEPF